MLLMIWVFACVVFLLILNSYVPHIKGKVGEGRVQLWVNQQLNPNIYHLINHITLPTSGHGSTQIDHILVSVYGVFVIETKNMTGWIFGSEYDKTWTQTIYKRKQKFQNPMHQNYGHIKALERVLELNESQLHSVIAFVGDCNIKTKLPANVTQGLDCIRYIKSKTRRVLSQQQVAQAIKKIEELQLPRSRRTDKDHKRYVRHRRYIKELRDAERKSESRRRY